MAAFTTGRAPQSGQVSINAEGSPVDEWHQFEPAPKWRRLSIALQTLFEHPRIKEAPATAQVSPASQPRNAISYH